MSTQRTGRDWQKARRLYEQEQRTFTEIAAFLGCDRHTVAAHAEQEGWINTPRVRRELAENSIREFVKREHEAVLANLAEKHQIATRLLGLAAQHVSQLEQGQEPNARAVKAIRDLAVAVKTLEDVDSAIAGLKDGAWRNKRPNESGEPRSNLSKEELLALLRPPAKNPST